MVGVGSQAGQMNGSFCGRLERVAYELAAGGKEVMPGKQGGGLLLTVVVVPLTL